MRQKAVNDVIALGSLCLSDGCYGRRIILTQIEQSEKNIALSRKVEAAAQDLASTSDNRSVRMIITSSINSWVAKAAKRNRIGRRTRAFPLRLHLLQAVPWRRSSELMQKRLRKTPGATTSSWRNETTSSETVRLVCMAGQLGIRKGHPSYTSRFCGQSVLLTHRAGPDG